MAKPRKPRTVPKLAVATRRRRKTRTPITPPFVDFSPTEAYRVEKCPAGTKKKKCVAQLMFVRGKRYPVIRFCDRKGSKGISIEVRSVDEALKVADSMCKCMKKGGKSKRCKTKIRKAYKG